MIRKFKLVLLLILFVSCQNNENQAISIPIEGTWELLSETRIEHGDTTITLAAKTQRMIKILNKSHFAFLRHTLNASLDSTAFVAGGGTYSLNGNVYKEHLEFFGSKEWENHDFNFEVEIIDDILIQKGEEKIEGTNIDRFIIERYRRVKN